jgi:hypothetical protein
VLDASMAALTNTAESLGPDLLIHGADSHRRSRTTARDNPPPMKCVMSRVN